MDMPIAAALTLYSALLKFTLNVHPDRLDYVDQVLGSCVKKLAGEGQLEDRIATKQIVALLSAPLEKYNDVVIALKLPNYPRVMEHLDNETNKVMAVIIIQSIMKNNTCISTGDKVEALFELIKGLIKDFDGAFLDEDEDDFKVEQNSVARLIQMLHSDDPEEMLKGVFKQFGGSGYAGSDNIMAHDAELQHHQKLERLYISTRAGKVELNSIDWANSSCSLP